jgi:hypothetical protein
MSYRLEGKVLEVCTCNVICPCWVAHDPDGGQCLGALAYHFEAGLIDGVDVSGLTIAMFAHIPGNVTAGNWRALVFIDENASDDQERALIEVFTGKAGGPVADFAQLVGEVIAVERVPITFEVSEGEGRLLVGDTIEADIEALVGATGNRTVLAETAFSTIPGSPAYCAKSRSYKVHAPEHGYTLDISGRNAIQGDFVFDAA